MNTHGSALPDTPAGKELQRRLHDEHTLEVLNRLLDRIDSLERTVTRLTELVEQGPGMVSMVTDMADEAMSHAKTNGIEVEDRLRNALILAERLTAPEMVTKLDQLLSLFNQAPGMASMVTDIVDENFRMAAARGVNVDERFRAGLELVQQLTHPDMVRKLQGLIGMAEQSSGLIAMAMDIFDESYQKALEQGLDLERLLGNATSVTKRLSALLNSDEYQALMASGILSPETLSTVSGLGQALVESRQAPPRQVGLWGLMRSLGDPDVQRAIAFLTDFARAFGQKLKD
ncbi:MAG: DUF1641 domain-containing protein [Bacteroidetes bacterium]|nr:MAG: DUF1641 domain-containing protein [Bacteroidota bacterium]